jgi:predicted nucleic acid-binding protein
VSVVYLETSALLHWLLDQKRSGEVRRVIDHAESVVTSALTLTETARVLTRAESVGDLREADTQRLRGLLQRAQASWTKMSVSADVLARAARVFPVEPVRTLDAIHLATALEFTSIHPTLKLLSDDRRIRDNADALGIGAA